MATTTNFNWETPDDTDLVKDGASAIRTLGSSIDTSFVDLKGGTSGQILSKASNTDLDYTWITNDIGDITAVTAGTGLSGGGTSGAVTLSIDTATTVDLTTAQTLTNKTLTSPVITTPTQRLSFNAQTGTTYTLVAADASYKLVTASNASAITVTVPPSVYSTGDVINVQQIGAGQVTFAQGAGVTITSTGATASAPILRARYSAATVICTASNVFTVIGDLS
jgi:hypothetical protein